MSEALRPGLQKAADIPPERPEVRPILLTATHTPVWEPAERPGLPEEADTLQGVQAVCPILPAAAFTPLWEPTALLDLPEAAYTPLWELTARTNLLEAAGLTAAAPATVLQPGEAVPLLLSALTAAQNFPAQQISALPAANR